MQKPPLNSSASLTLMYSASFLLCIFFGALLKQIGTPGNYVNIMMFALIVGGYIFSGMFAKTMILPVFKNADRTGKAFYMGQSLAAGAISSGVFIFLSGDFYTNGTDALTLYSGLILGIALMTVLFAAPINRSNSSTLPSLFTHADGSKFIKFMVLIIVVTTSVLLLYVQLSAIGMVSEAFFSIPEKIAILITVFTIGFCLIMGGMQSLSIIRMLAYPILLIAFIAPAIWVAYKLTGNPIPQLSFGTGALRTIAEIDQEMINAQFSTKEEIFNFTKDGLNFDFFNHFAALLCIAFGTASMPHLLQHFRTLPKATHARKTGVWGLGFVLLIITAIPAIAAFIKLDIYTALLGLQLSDLQQEGSWLFDLNKNGASIISICGEYVTNTAQTISACGNAGDYFLTSNDIGVNPDMMLLASGVINELPDLVTTLLATGALLAIWSTVDGLILVCANALAEDGYRSFFRPKSPMGSRLFVTRVFLILMLTLSAYLVLNVNLDSRFVFAACFALLTACLFPALIFKIWTKDFSQPSIVTGLIIAFLLTSSMLWLSHFGLDLIAKNGDEFAFRIPVITDEVTPLSMGLIGMIVSLCITLLTSKFLKAKAAKTEHNPHVKNEIKSDVPA